MNTVAVSAQAQALLKNILDVYDGNEYKFVSVPAMGISPNLQGDLEDVLHSLKGEKLITSYQVYTNRDLFVTVTDEGLAFFKEPAEETAPRARIAFLSLSGGAEELLRELLQAERRNQTITHFLQGKLDNTTPQQNRLVRGLLGELCDKKYITLQWVDTIPFWGTIEPFGRTYFERKKADEINRKNLQRKVYNSGGVYKRQELLPRDITDSDLPVDLLIKQVYRLIEENGGTKTGDFKEMMVEIQDLIENIRAQKCIPKNTGLLKRLESNFGEYNWFCGAITQLVGKTVLELLPQAG